MTRKADFNAEEWSLVLQGPPTAGMVVVAADRGGTLRESFSMAKVYAEERQRQGASELLDDIVSAQPEFDQSRFRSPEAIGEQGIASLREAVQVLESKASPEDVEAYKQFIVGLADRVAHAHKEGGFLGVGGKDVSEQEQAALDEIATALGTSRA